MSRAPSSMASTTCGPSPTRAIAARIEGGRAPGRRRLGLDRRRDRRLGSPEGMRGDGDRDGLTAVGARARPGGRPDLSRPPSRPRGRVPARDDGRALRGPGSGRAGGDPGRRDDRDRLRRRRHRGRSGTGLVEAAGIRIDNGILVDEQLETSAPGVFAAGDVANARHPFYGRHLRVEHWANALHQGAVAAGRDARPGRSPTTRSLLLLRPVRRRHGVQRLRDRNGTRSSSAAMSRRASSSPSGSRTSASSPA